jgi:hypothetical protein
MILDLLLSTNSEDEDEEDIKGLVEAVLRLFWVKCMGHLENIEAESEILRNAPPRDLSSRGTSNPDNQTDETWRLDKPLNTGPVLDKSGRVSTTSYFETSFWCLINSSLFVHSQYYPPMPARERGSKPKSSARTIGYPQ